MQQEFQERNERIDLRVPEYVKARIRAAAGLTGRNMSDFIIAAALAQAEEVVESVERWTLDEEQSLFVLNMLSSQKNRPKLLELLKLSDPQRKEVLAGS